MVVDCTTRDGPVELAMSPSSLTGFQAWLESPPPGTDWRDRAVQPHGRPGAPARNAVALSFVLNGFLFASWVSRIPETRSRLDLDNGALGLLLLCDLGRLAAGAADRPAR